MKRIVYSFLFCLCAGMVSAQENIAPLYYNPVVRQAPANQFGAVAKTTADTLQLPFFEDFTTYFRGPDDARWTDREVYVNNTMCVNPVSRGVATFDALNQNGIPYNPVINIALVYADSLTTKPINLSNNQPSDSIYLSFFYQPQGSGFSPETQDSLMLYFRKDSSWVKIWAIEGTALRPFKQVMIPVTDPQFFHKAFQFRFVNKASINLNDDVWNVDYIRMSANRNMNDTAVDDIAYTVTPSYMLKDYTYMPYHQYLADKDNERAAQHESVFQNNTTTQQSITYGYTATAEASGQTALLYTSPAGNATVNGGQQQQVSLPVYANLPSFAPEKNHGINFINKFYLQSAASGSVENDTIIREQLFHNYFAYDDGSAEKSYFLSQFATLPGKIAIQYHMNEADTLTGVAIYFGRQVPMGYNKYFSVAVYQDITTGTNNENILYQEDFLYPGYLDVNNFYVYKFTNKVPVPKGKFYIGTIQPALANSDSLYIGLDVNRVGAGHLYYNVLAKWEASTIPGALMIRPMTGPVFPSDVTDVAVKTMNWNLYPNPSQEQVFIHYSAGAKAGYEICDMQGRAVKRGVVGNDAAINISELNTGIYFVRIICNGIVSAPRKLVKL